MLDKLLQAALRPSLITRVVTEELERLERGGFLSAGDVERLSTEAQRLLAERVARTQGAVAPVLGGLATAMREALDIPSRAEVLALTEALRRAEATRAGPAAPPAPPPA